MDQNVARRFRPMLVFDAIDAQALSIEPDLIIGRVLGQRCNEILRAMPMIAQVHVHTVDQKLYGNVPLVHAGTNPEARDELRTRRTHRPIQIGMPQQHTVQAATGDLRPVRRPDAGKAIGVAKVEPQNAYQFMDDDDGFARWRSAVIGARMGSGRRDIVRY